MGDIVGELVNEVLQSRHDYTADQYNEYISLQSELEGKDITLVEEKNRQQCRINLDAERGIKSELTRIDGD